MKALTLLFALACAALAGDLAIGYRQQGMTYQGPGDWRQPAEPIWVYDYHILRLSYRVTGLPANGAPVLTLRPGSVGPVTPGATNPENPFVAGMPVVAVLARDLIADGAPHSLDIELRGKVRTAQVDQLRFSLPAGARLAIDDLQFRGDADVFPCRAAAPGLPPHAEKLEAAGPSTCAGFPATSLRGRESIRIPGKGHRSRTLYLSLMAHFAGASAFGADQRVKESSETTGVIARIRYKNGSEEEQFPMLVAERRHALLNRKPALYALELDPNRPLSDVELLDRSVHAQLVLYGAGLSATAAPASLETERVPQMPPVAGPKREPDFTGSAWYRMSVPGNRVRAEFHDETEPAGRRLSLALTNIGREPQEFTLTFPALTIRPAADTAGVYYVFPRQGAVIARDERKLEAAYSAAFPLQFMDVFAPGANSGACVVVQDTGGRGKKFRLDKTGPVVKAEVEYLVRLAPGETFHPPDAQVTTHGGDWHEGFEIYRNWLNSWYKPAGPRPVWLRTAFWARRDYPVGGSGHLFDVRHNRYTFEDLIRDGEAFGGIDFIDISGWALSEKSGRVGDYPIELGGAADLRGNVTAALKQNVPTGLYFEGYLIDKNSNVGRRFGQQWQMITRDGRGFWWPGGSPELFVCPYVTAWQRYLAGRVAAVARETGVAGVYLDEYGFGDKRCYSTAHGHPPGVESLPGEIAMAREVRGALDAGGMRSTILYLEETPPDAAAPYFDAAFSYDLPFSDRTLSPLKLNLSRFAFPDVRLWDMLSIGIDPRVLSAEDFRLSLWHGNGVWLKGHAESWYGADLLAFIRRAREILKQHAGAFSGPADPLVRSPHPAVYVNRFTGTKETVYTLFNASYRTARFAFAGNRRTLGPRDVDVVSVPIP